MSRLGVLVACGLFAACSNPFTPRSVVNGLRILAVRAEPPEAAPGQIVRLDGLVVTASGAATLEWYACAPSSSALSPCEDPGLLTDFEALIRAPGVRSLGTSSVARYRVEDDASASSPVLILLRARFGREEVRALKRVPLRQAAAPNSNPEIAFVVFKGIRAEVDQTLSFRSAAEIPCSAIVTATSAETYERSHPDGRVTTEIEDLRYEWFTTHGRYGVDYQPPSGKPVVELFIDSGVPAPRDAAIEEGGGESSSDEFGLKVTLRLPEAGAEALRARIFVVVRDMRGGVAWREQTLRVSR